ncbi:NlpC/P60 family protein [Neobacillus mesonae]|nr:NlpC/P60 family protein [Neobacillus mesonae]
MIKKLFKYSVSVAVLTSMIQVTPAFADTVTQDQINATQVQIDDFENKIQMLDDRIIMAMEKSQALKEEINKQQGKIKETETEIEEAKKALEIHKEVYSERLKSLQSEGKESLATYAELLLSSDDFSQFLTRFTAISAILQNDSDLLTGLNEKQQALNNAEEKLHNELNNLKQNQNELAAEQQKIEVDKKEIAKELEATKSKLQNQKDQYAQQEAEKEAARQARLAEQRAQEQARQAERQRSQTQTQTQPEQRVQNQEKPQVQSEQRQERPKASVNNESKAASSDDGGGSTASASASQVIANAKKYLGVPYVWGGTTPSGFDCSGFTSYVFRSVGISLPRVSRDQQRVGTRISTSQVRPGDLVFRGNPAHHVGIYIGNGQYIHAPQTGDVVKISPYNPSKFTTAARVLH